MTQVYHTCDICPAKNNYSKTVVTGKHILKYTPHIVIIFSSLAAQQHKAQTCCKESFYSRI